MISSTTQRAALEALAEDLLHACLGAPEGEVQAAYDEGCRAIAELSLSPEGRIWVDSELQRIGEHFDLR